MGCPLSKTSDENDVQSKQNDFSNEVMVTNKTVDPRLPLTVRQKFNLSKSWKGISREMEMTGVLMFVKLFEETPEILNLFTKFQELKTKDSQMKSMELAEHATKVMTNLDEMINSLDDMDYFFRHLHSLGKYHRRIPGFHKDNFLKLEKPFIEAVKEVLQERYTENMANIYNIIIKLILQTISEGFEKDFD
ncbi:Neuroglobin [Sarcoptes scabiei]|uniref:Neuroglobin n=1 Tax=Sarcoptes scabiei TaxID=52283 RepID=A0A132A436_SARSC|nr:Neuroglobin [Sarcoptes scabiei]KPM05752.1 neuroglobin-like protein [Sarcoptes scabiei]